MKSNQKILPQDKIAAFYHDNFVEAQVHDFIALVKPTANHKSEVVVDIGGGCGFFAKAVYDNTGLRVRVLDSDPFSVSSCKKLGIEAVCDDALEPNIIGDESVVCFNLILHHLIGKSEEETRTFQKRALSVWKQNASAIFINEYIYESFVMDNISGWFIFQITSNSILSKLSNLIAKMIPSLKANTSGVGVRFRSHAEWVEMFESLGFDVVDSMIGIQEGISLPRRLLLIKNCRRDSFLLKPRSMKAEIMKKGER